MASSATIWDLVSAFAIMLSVCLVLLLTATLIKYGRERCAKLKRLLLLVNLRFGGGCRKLFASGLSYLVKRTGPGRVLIGQFSTPVSPLSHSK